jgi:hypothetical protein
MSLSTPLRPSLGKIILFAFLFTIFQLSFSSLASAQPTVVPIIGSPAIANPCATVGFQTMNLSGVLTVSKIAYYGNGVLVAPYTYAGTTVENISMNSNDGGNYYVYAIVYYTNGSSVQTVPYQQELHGIGLNALTQSGPADLNCTSPVTFSSSGFVSALYVPTPADVASYTWSYPSSNWTFISGNTSGNSLASTVTVAPDASSAGNVAVTATLFCGYTVTSTVVVPRPTVSPTFGSNPTAICNDATNTFTINAPCGPTSYNWTLSGNTGATFQATGTQSLTTTSTSAVISSGSVGNSNVTLSVESVYPGGVTSGAAAVNIATGILPAPTEIIPASKIEKVSPNSLPDFISPGASYWTVTNGTITSGQGTDDILVKVANVSSGYLYVYASAQDACGTSSSIVSYSQIESNSPPPFIYNSGIFSDSTIAITSSNPLIIPLPSGPSLYPNPSTNSFQVLIPPTDFTKTYVKIYDLSGHSMQTIIPGGQSTLVDASHWAKGTYIVSIFDGQKLTTQKFVKL